MTHGPREDGLAGKGDGVTLRRVGPVAGAAGGQPRPPGTGRGQYGRVWPRPSIPGQHGGYVRAAPRGQVAVTGVTPFFLIRTGGPGRTGGGGYVRLR